MAQQERNLLFGVLAVQLRIVTPKQLVMAGSVWAANQERSLDEILVEQGAISSRQQRLITELMDEQVEAQGGDASIVLDRFGGESAVYESFCGSIVYDKETGAKYQSLGSDAPERAADAVAGRELSGTGHLTVEHPGRYSVKGEKGRGRKGRS